MKGKQVTILDILTERDFEAEELLEKKRIEKENELVKMKLWVAEYIGDDDEGNALYGAVEKEVMISKKKIGFKYYKTKKAAEKSARDMNNFKNYGRAWYEI